jgi:hypothetical protein
MSAVIEAAWIGLGGVVAGGLAGVAGAVVVARMTARTTLAAITTGTANVREQIAADRNNRIWERRAAAYVDAIAGIRHRQKVRGCQIVGTRVGTEPERPKVPADWVDVEARLIAYSSQGILAALRAASDGGRRFEDQIALWQADTDKAHAAQDLARQGVVPPAWAPSTTPGDLEVAQKEADQLDDALIDQIRVELLGGAGAAFAALSGPEPTG